MRNVRMLVVSSLVSLVFPTGCDRRSDPAAETADARPLVKIGHVEATREFVDGVKAQGTVRTRNSASVSARVPGTLDAVLVEEGTFVKKGTVLFKVDEINLRNAVRVAEDDLALAKAKLVQAETMDAKAKLDIGRMERLVSAGAVTKDAWEKADVQAKSAAAGLDAAKAAVTKAGTALEIAKKNLDDSCVKAPFDGTVTRKRLNAGDYVSPGKAVFEMDDTGVYELCVSLNAAWYGRVKVGKTLIGDRPVTYKSASVNPVTRTFEIRCELEKDVATTPGMIRTVEVVFAKRKAQGVPSAAVGLRGGGDCVFKVADGKVARVAVETGVSRDGWTEIRSPSLEGADIVVEGMLLVNEGEEVRSVPQ